MFKINKSNNKQVTIRIWDMTYVREFYFEHMYNIKNMSLGIFEDSNIVPVSLVKYGLLENSEDFNEENTKMWVDGINYSSCGTPCIFVQFLDDSESVIASYIEGFSVGNKNYWIKNNLNNLEYINRKHYILSDVI